METNKNLLKLNYVELIYKTSIKSTDRIGINDPDGDYLLAKENLGERMEHHDNSSLKIIRSCSSIQGMYIHNRCGYNIYIPAYYPLQLF